MVIVGKGNEDMRSVECQKTAKAVLTKKSEAKIGVTVLLCIFAGSTKTLNTALPEVNLTETEFRQKTICMFSLPWCLNLQLYWKVEWGR